MKFKVGDQVILTAGKDKGKKGAITRVIPAENKVVVEDCNLYTKHVRKYAGQAGQKTILPRPLPTAKIAILNEKGQPDRIGYKLDAKGVKQRFYKKTGTLITKQAEAKKAVTEDKKAAASAVKVAAKAKKTTQKTK